MFNLIQLTYTAPNHNNICLKALNVQFFQMISPYWNHIMITTGKIHDINCKLFVNNYHINNNNSKGSQHIKWSGEVFFYSNEHTLWFIQHGPFLLHTHIPVSMFFFSMSKCFQWIGSNVLSVPNFLSVQHINCKE